MTLSLQGDTGNPSSRITANWIWLDDADVNEGLFLEICSLRVPLPLERYSILVHVMETTPFQGAVQVCVGLSQ
jgi:hypothetical protein